MIAEKTHTEEIYIDQFVNTLQYGDAISGEVLTIQRVLRSMGFNSNIVSLHTHQKYLGMTTSVDEFINNRKDKKGVLINHFSISSPLNDLFKNYDDKKLNTKKVIVYHNMTPSKWYQGYNSRVFSDLEKGRIELSAIKDWVDLAISDSSFNATELIELGFKNVEILNLPLDPKRWEITSNPGIRKVLKEDDSIINILHVGRFAPNKKIEDIIRIFYFYHHKLNKKSKLWLIGNDTDTELYSFELKRMVKKFKLDDSVNFCGTVSDDELKSFYECADIYLCTSEHEGFCVPVIEAFNFDLPVISFGGTALTDTLGNGALIIENRDCILAAFSINEIIINKENRESLTNKAKEELSRFDIEKFSNRLITLIKDKVLSD